MSCSVTVRQTLTTAAALAAEGVIHRHSGLLAPIMHLEGPMIYTVIHNYGNLYEKWNIFVAWPHLWPKISMVKRETVLNLSTLRYHAISSNVTSLLI